MDPNDILSPSDGRLGSGRSTLQGCWKPPELTHVRPPGVGASPSYQPPSHQAIPLGFRSGRGGSFQPAKTVGRRSAKQGRWSVPRERHSAHVQKHPAILQVRGGRGMSAGAGWGSRSQRRRSLSREAAAFASVQPRREVRGGRAGGTLPGKGRTSGTSPAKPGSFSGFCALLGLLRCCGPTQRGCCRNGRLPTICPPQSS